MFEAEVKEDPQTGDLYIEFDNKIMEELGWKEGDELIWEGNHNTYYVRKKDAPSVERTE
jgi:hypothetical protein